MYSLPSKRAKNISHKPGRPCILKDDKCRTKRSRRRRRRREVKQTACESDVRLRPKVVQKRPVQKTGQEAGYEEQRKLVDASSALINAQIDFLAVGFHRVIGCSTEGTTCPVINEYETLKNTYIDSRVNMRCIAMKGLDQPSEGRCFCCYGPPTCWINCKYGGIFLRNSKKHRKSNTPACWDCLGQIVWCGRKMHHDPLAPVCPLCRGPGKKWRQGHGWTAILGRRYPKKKLPRIYYEEGEYPNLDPDSTLPEMPLHWKGIIVNILCTPCKRYCWNGHFTTPSEQRADRVHIRALLSDF